MPAILKYTNYAMVARPTEQGAGIQVYVYPDFSEGASNNGPVAGEKDGVGQAPDLAPQSAEIRPQDAVEEVPPAPPDVFDPDPTVRVRELKDTVASYGPQSLALVLAAAQDLDPLVRSASEQLLLKDLRNVVPKETLSTIALASQRTDIWMQALEALAERQDQSDYVRMTLDNALHDPDPGVQQRAKELLLKLSKPGPDSTQ